MPRRLPLSCRRFRNQHAEFTDGLLSIEAMRALQTHREACAPCARHDVAVRRSLLALQSLRTIAPSAGFHEHLMARIASGEATPEPTRTGGMRWGVVSGLLAASIVLLLAATSYRPSVAPVRLLPVRLLPVLARAPERPSVELPVTSIAAAPASRNGAPRFEAVSTAPTGALPQAAKLPAVRLQLASYLGQ
jgi:hypothetical protein